MMEEQILTINGATLTPAMINRVRDFQKEDNGWIKDSEENAQDMIKWLIGIRSQLDNQDSNILDMIGTVNGFIEEIKVFAV